MSLSSLLESVKQIKKNIPEQSVVRSLQDLQNERSSHQSSEQSLTLQQLERLRMRRDRSGIIFSNVLCQVRAGICSFIHL